MKLKLLVFLIAIQTARGQEPQLTDIFSTYDGEELIDELNKLSGKLASANPLKADSINNLILGVSTIESYPSGKALLFKNIGGLLSRKGQLDSAIRYYKISASLYNDLRDKNNQLRVLFNISRRFEKLYRYDSAIHYGRLAATYAKEVGDSMLMAVTNKGLGSCFRLNADLDSALLYMNRSLNASQNVDGPYYQHALVGLANIYIAKEDYVTADKYMNRAVRWGMSNSYDDRYTYNSMAVIKTSLNDYDSARFYYKKSLLLSNKVKDIRFSAMIQNNLAQSYLFEGIYDSAEIESRKGLKLAVEADDIGTKAFNLSTLSSAFVKQKMWAEGKEAAQRALVLLDEIGDTEKKIYALDNLSESEFHLGNMARAYEIQKERYEVSQDFLNETKERALSELQTKFETERKEAKISSLSQQASIQALEIQQKNQAIVIGSVIFLLVIGAIYFVYKQGEIKKRQSQTELEQRFLRSQLNPHFISNALVAVQSFMLRNDSKSAALYLTKFSKLMREILENSRREFIPVEEEISMLRNYMDIHQQRLGSFEYSIDLDEAIDPEVDTIPPMFVQPFVENAVEHGIGGIARGGKIDLKFKKEGDFIKVAVKDNGNGLSRNSDSDHQSLSTTIIRERIDLFNKTLKKKIQLVIDNIRNENGEVSGTKVELKVPFSYI